jgi:serine protein kinase
MGIDQLFSRSLQSYESQRQQEMPLLEYLELCRTDPMVYATAAERLVEAIGEPQVVDTAKDPRLGRLFSNRTIKVYPAFAEFYGMEDTVERIVNFFRYSAQGLERSSTSPAGG